MDMITVKDKRYRKSSDGTITEALIDEQIEDLYEDLIPIREKILCIGTGNHELKVIEAGTNPIARLCKMLSTDNHKIIHFGVGWLLKIIFSENGSRGRTIIIRGHHGWGGGSRTQGADITKYSHDVKFWQADLFIYGHVHKTKADIVEEGRMVGDNVWKTHQKKMLIAGTYQRTYTLDENTTWAENRGFPPVTIGSPHALLTPNHDAGVDVKIVM